jgi:hypothetical protein
MYLRSLPLGLLLSVLVVSACQREPVPSAPEAGSSGYATKRSGGGEVMFRVTPRGMEAGRFLVDVRVDTHSGDLAELDLRAATTLEASGRALHPIAPAALRGHHAGATLAFDLAEAPDRLEIVFTGVRGMPDVVLQWP